MLSSCASGPRVLDNDVQSFVGNTPPPVGATFRIDRLPSQKTDSKERTQLETLTTAALQRAGLQPDATQPQLSVQVDVQVQTFVRTPPLPVRMGRIVMAPDGTLWQPISPFMLESTWTRHRVDLILRDTATGQVALETQATFDGPWTDTLRLLPAILDGALRGYPTPPAGPRKVLVPLSENREASP
jgi:hypothetical protein